VASCRFVGGIKPNRAMRMNRAIRQDKILPRYQNGVRLEATLVGAAEGLDLSKISSSSEIYAINSAYFHLMANQIKPKALITGDPRFISKIGHEKIKTVSKLVTFRNQKPHVKNEIEEVSNTELFTCLGRDGFSTNAKAGFFHGCSSFFFAVQYLVYVGYTRINTLGVNFPPPELYSRLNGVSGHPEFVYDIQLSNLLAMREFMEKTNTEINCLDSNSNLTIYL
jgi:hypothetical protein